MDQQILSARIAKLWEDLLNFIYIFQIQKTLRVRGVQINCNQISHIFSIWKWLVVSSHSPCPSSPLNSAQQICEQNFNESSFRNDHNCQFNDSILDNCQDERRSLWFIQCMRLFLAVKKARQMRFNNIVRFIKFVEQKFIPLNCFVWLCLPNFCSKSGKKFII